MNTPAQWTDAYGSQVRCDTELNGKARKEGASHLKSVAKCFTWRGVAAVDSLLVILVVTGAPLTSVLGAVGLEAVTKIVWYYGHERLWESSWINRLVSRR